MCARGRVGLRMCAFDFSKPEALTSRSIGRAYSLGMKLLDGNEDYENEDENEDEDDDNNAGSRRASSSLRPLETSPGNDEVAVQRWGHLEEVKGG